MCELWRVIFNGVSGDGCFCFNGLNRVVCEIGHRKARPVQLCSGQALRANGWAILLGCMLFGALLFLLGQLCSQR